MEKKIQRTVYIAFGLGELSPEEQAKVFDRFYRVDKARSRETGGTGLGLYIVKRIALLHEGRVSIESKKGEGSVFRLHLPREGAAGRKERRADENA